MTASVQSFITGTLGLTVIFVVSLVIAWTRPSANSSHMKTVKTLVLIGITLHLVHLTEETIYLFYQQFPALLGLEPWPLWLFLGFNAGWIAIWCIGLLIRSPNTLLMAAFWFLAIASMVNGIAHPAFSIMTADYFPGLASSPLVGLLGILLTRALYQASAR